MQQLDGDREAERSDVLRAPQRVMGGEQEPRAEPLSAARGVTHVVPERLGTRSAGPCP